MPIDIFFNHLFSSLHYQFKHKKFCDVHLYAGSSNPASMNWISCHSMVLCTVAPQLKHILLDPDVCGEDGTKRIYFPDMNMEEISKFVNDIYVGMQSEDFSLSISCELASALGMFGPDISELDETTGLLSACPDSVTNHVLLVGDAYHPVVAYDNEELKTVLTSSEHEHELPEHSLAKEIKKRPAQQKRPSKRQRPLPLSNDPESDQPLKKRDPANRPAQGPISYNHKLGALLPHFKKIETAKNCFYKNSGTIRALVNSFYASSSIVSDPDNIIMVDGTPRQFRMKLPDTKLVALVAVGVRDGENILTTVSCNSKYWLRETTFINVIEMAKNVCGTSFGIFLRHPRRAEVNHDKICRESVERFKDEFRKLTENERNIIAAEHAKFLKDFDAIANKIEFHHLPQKAMKMEFTIVPDIRKEEIMDYAIVYGDNPNDLTIQTFINFSQTKFNPQRLLTIMCDTLSCFLGLDNQTPLTDCAIFKESFENYSKRTSQVLAVQELGSSSSEPINPHAVITPKRIVRDAAKTNMKRNIIDDRRKFPCTADGCNMAFMKESSRQAHFQRIHSAVDENVSKGCSLCGKTLRGAQELKVHIYYHHSQKECKKCNMVFPGAYTLYYHNARFHSEPQTCDICGQSCKNREKLKKHKINKHMEDHLKPYVCKDCGRGYAEKTKLESHQMNVHIRIRPFKCRLEGCEADFNEMANRNAHEKNVHKYDYKKAMKDLEGAPLATSQTQELQNSEEYLELSSTSHDQIL